MKILFASLAIFSTLWITACKPTEPTDTDVSPEVPVVEQPAATADGDATAKAPEAKAAAETTETKTAAAQTWDFEDAALGRLPSGWSAAKTGEGPGSEWKVLRDESAPAGSNVLSQVSPEGPNRLFCLCIADETSYDDVDLSVALKGVQGKIDQGGGPVWRLQDENNYYVARMNPLEFNFRLYKVIDGKRTKLASADVDVPEADVDADDPLLNKWHTIRVVHRGDQIQCYFNGELRLEFEDDSIDKAGKIGLWAKADAVTSFDNLSVATPSE